MHQYTLSVLIAVPSVVAAELAWFRTGLFRKPSYWGSLAVIFAFQVAVDGWLTKLSAPIVVYSPGHFSGVRFPWDIPVEDFAFGFALVTITMLCWERIAVRHPRR